MLPWEVLHLVASHLDPKTLAVASCVSKLWSFSMASDHLWQPIFAAHFPSLSPLFPVSPSVSYRRLYSLGNSATKMRHRIPADPLQLSLSDLVFTVNMATAESPRFLSATKSAHELAMKPSGTFRFDMEINGDETSETIEVPENMRITWIVVLGSWRGIFTMMDREEKVEGMQGGTGTEGWFSEELPSPTCCRIEGVTSGMVSDVKLGLSSRNDETRKKKITRVSVGILSVISWSYVSVEDGLRYLQHFLLPRHQLFI